MESIGPIVAGTFYPADPDRLRSDLDAMLAAASPRFAGELGGLIVPHAGYRYSGPVAATAYALLERDSFDRVVLIGPSHFVRFGGVAAAPGTRWVVPNGVIPIDRTDAVATLAEPFLTEHSLEVQLPFLLATLGAVPVLPLLTGDVDPGDAADALDEVVGEDALLVVSTDLSHYLGSEAARRVDAATAAAVVALEPERLGWEAACGRSGLQAAMLLSKRRGWRPRLLDLRNSGDTAGDPSRVVGYGAFAMGPA